jgi:hypothetical protein
MMIEISVIAGLPDLHKSLFYYLITKMEEYCSNSFHLHIKKKWL